MKRSTFSTHLLCLLLLSINATAQNVGIGVNTPQGRLHIKGNADTSQLVIDASATQGRVPLIRLRNVAGQDRIHIHADSSVNAFFGLNAGKKNTANLLLQGIYNTAIGSEAAQENVIGINNTAIGYRSLFANAGSYNTAAGSWALTENTSGEYNTATGVFSLRNNSTGNDNTAFGYRSLRANTTGLRNTALGSNTLSTHSSGWLNTAIGAGAMELSSSGFGNTAVGTDAFRKGEGFSNTAVGNSSLSANLATNYNTAIGSAALLNNTTGSRNTALGANSLQNNTTGWSNIAIGIDAGTNACCQFDNTISIGNDGYLNGWHNQIFLGNLSMTWNGGNVAWGTYSDARIKTNIQEEVKGLDFILRLRPVTYYRSVQAALQLTGNKDETRDYPAKYDIEKIRFSGFLAQEVEAAAAESGYDFSGVQKPKSSQPLYTLTYESFVAPLVKAVQEQQALINELKSEVAALKKQNDEMMKAVQLLKEK
jgi:trimeric autotransporter adhesin